MTRGYIVFTEDGATSANAVYLDSSAYPSHYGLILLETIQKGKPLNTVEKKPGFPLSEFDEVVRATRVANNALPNAWMKRNAFSTASSRFLDYFLPRISRKTCRSRLGSCQAWSG